MRVGGVGRRLQGQGAADHREALRAVTTARVPSPSALHSTGTPTSILLSLASARTLMRFGIKSFDQRGQTLLMRIVRVFHGPRRGIVDGRPRRHLSAGCGPTIALTRRSPYTEIPCRYGIPCASCSRPTQHVGWSRRDAMIERCLVAYGTQITPRHWFAQNDEKDAGRV